MAVLWVEAEVALPTADILPVIMIMMTENLIKNATAIVVEVEEEVVGAITVVSRGTSPGNVQKRVMVVEVVVAVEVEVVEDLVAEPHALNVGKKDTFLGNVLIIAEEIIAVAPVEEVDVITVEKRVTFPENALMPEEIRAREEEEEIVAAVAVAQEEVDVFLVESQVIFQESVLKAPEEEGIKQNVRK